MSASRISRPALPFALSNKRRPPIPLTELAEPDQAYSARVRTQPARFPNRHSKPGVGPVACAVHKGRSVPLVKRRD